MKWGVRRYQNSNGSYTREGLRRYYESKNRYDSAKSNYKQNKTSSNALELKNSKRQLKNDYKQLKKDYKADKGKNIYASGKTITDINFSPSAKASGFLVSAGVAAAAYALKNIPSHIPTTIANRRIVINGNPIPLKNVAIGLGLATITVGALIGVKNRKQIQELRAYYGHSRTPVNHRNNIITSTVPNQSKNID